MQRRQRQSGCCTPAIAPDCVSDGRGLEAYVPPDGLTPKQVAQVDRPRHHAESKGIEFTLKEWP